MRSGNPALSKKSFEGFDILDQSHAMTLNGTVVKTGILLALVTGSASLTWNAVLQQNANTGPLMMGGMIGGLIFGMVTCFKPNWSPVTAPIYAIAEGLFLGGLSAMINARYPGIAFQAVGLTFGTLASLLFAYSSGLIKATENFKLGVVAATGGICLVYLASIVMGFFGMSIPLIHGSGPVGIGFSVFVVIIAALNLVLDFDFIEHGAERGAPKYMEWYGAFGLMVTLIWLYIEILRLLAKLQSRD
ncbi:hypothetical protein GC176_07675 [bacterium]|nr:hypothetical protein [bacterium]